MSTSDFSRSLPILLAFLFAVGCEKPEQRPPEPKAEPETSPDPSTAETPGSRAPSSGASSSEQPEETEAEPRPEPEQPELSVRRRGDVIVIEGALKSRIQVERIGSQLAEACPDLEIDNQLRKESHRHGVGWGNRITRMFLIPYFHEIEKPAVRYREGIITLEGDGEQSDFRKFGQLAVDAFAGMFSRDIENRIGKGEEE